MPKPILALLILASISACNSNDSRSGEVNCPDVINAAIHARIYELESGNALCGTEALLIEDEYAEEMVITESESCSSAIAQGGLGRPGMYQVIVSKEGYETWSSEVLNVESGICGVQTYNIDVYLKKM